MTESGGILAHLPALQIVIPILSAPILVLAQRGNLAKVWSILVGAYLFWGATTMLGMVQASGPITYQMGGWAPHVGISLQIDLVNAYLLVIVAMISTVVLAFGPTSRTIRAAEGRRHLYYAAFLLNITGLNGICATGDAFNVFVFLEITSLSSYTLIALGRTRKALRAAFSYLIMGTIGGTFLLLGIGLMYQATGTLNMAELAVALPELTQSRSARVALGFLTVGASIKLAVFPLHQWLPNAYTYAPSAVSAYMAATGTKVSFYVLVRIIFTLFGATFVFDEMKLHLLLLPMGLAAMFGGSLAALYQTNLKRLLAYSSIAQIGYMCLGLSLNSVTGLTGSLVHLFNHALMKGGLFLVVACIGFQVKSTNIDDMAGIAKRMPVTFFAFVIGGLAMIGVPGTVGFVSKWYLVLGVLEAGMAPLAVLILLSSLLAVLYIWKVIEIAWFREPPEGAVRAEAPLTMLIPTWILIGATVVFGLWTPWTTGVAEAAAKQLMGVP